MPYSIVLAALGVCDLEVCVLNSEFAHAVELSPKPVCFCQAYQG